MKRAKALPAELQDAQGVVIYRGPSLIDPTVEVVAIATGFIRPSVNAKTGPMIQVWIFRADMSPLEANKLGQDGAACGGCPHRGVMGPDGVVIDRTCYVNLGQGPRGVFVTFVAGDYPECPESLLGEMFSGESVRLGAFGDPAAVPVAIWDAVVSRARMHTGYSHQWKSARLRDVTRYVQCSVDSEQEAARATGLGLGYFRVKRSDEPMLAGETYCPSDSGVQCIDCGACSGKGARVVIDVHGSGKKHFGKTRKPLTVLPMAA